MSAFDIIIGDAEQPTIGFSIVMGDGEGGGEPDPDGVLLDVTLPSVPLGTLMLIVVVHDGPVFCSDTTWRHVGDGGADGIFIDVYARRADGTAGSLEDDVVSFMSEDDQELQGTLVTMSNALIRKVVGAVVHAEFTGDATPAAPAVTTKLDDDTVLCIWSVDGVVGLLPPPGFSEIDTYTSAEVDASDRSILVAARDPDLVAEINPGDATASSAATGRAFTLLLRSTLAQPEPIEAPAVVAEVTATDHVEEALGRLVHQLARVK